MPTVSIVGWVVARSTNDDARVRIAVAADYTAVDKKSSR